MGLLHELIFGVDADGSCCGSNSAWWNHVRRQPENRGGEELGCEQIKREDTSLWRQYALRIKASSREPAGEAFDDGPASDYNERVGVRWDVLQRPYPRR